ncbi:MAG: hypothetical protein ABJG47_02700 [Ekhidna sp.]
MSKKVTIEDRVKSLEAREEKIKLQLDADSDVIKGKAMRVGKIALISGIVAIVGYWVFNIIFDDGEKKPKRKKKKIRNEGNFSSRIVALAMPYLNKILEGILEDENVEEKEKESKES